MSKDKKSLPPPANNQSISIAIVEAADDRTHFLRDLLMPDADESFKDVSKVIDRFKQCHERCASSIKQSLRHAIDCGRIAEMLRAYYGHGQWTKRFEEELQPKLGVSLRTVERYINVYRQFQKFALQSGSPLNLDDEDAHTARLLSEFKLEDKRKAKSDLVSPNDWITPKEWMATVISFLLKIDCDPCAWDAHLPNRDVIAVSYSKDDGSDGGLSDELPWSGRCWIAPGHKGDFSRWVQKAINELKLGEMKEALMLLPSYCLSNPELLNFDFVAISQPLTISVSGKKGTRQQVVRERMLIHYLSLSPDLERFVVVFGSMGTVYARHVATPTAINKS